MEPTSTPEVAGPESRAGTQNDVGDTGGRRHSTIFVVAVAVVAAAVAGGAGAVAGWQFEKDRAESDIENVRPVGIVTALTGDTMTVRLRTAGGQRVYTITDSTVIDTATDGDAGDIEEGATVLVKSQKGSDGSLDAREIVVLPDTSTWSSGRGASE